MPDGYCAKWLDHQSGKAARGLAALDAAPPADDEQDIGAISVACALGYLDLRFGGRWRADHPKLVRWLEVFDATAAPAFAETVPRNLMESRSGPYAASAGGFSSCFVEDRFTRLLRTAPARSSPQAVTAELAARRARLTAAL
jgi:hypothetical protein